MTDNPQLHKPVRLCPSKASLIGGCMACRMTRQTIGERVWLIEIGGSNITTQVRLCDLCVTELSQALRYAFKSAVTTGRKPK